MTDPTTPAVAEDQTTPEAAPEAPPEAAPEAASAPTTSTATDGVTDIVEDVDDIKDKLHHAAQLAHALQGNSDVLRFMNALLGHKTGGA